MRQLQHAFGSLLTLVFGPRSDGRDSAPGWEVLFWLVVFWVLGLYVLGGLGSRPPEAEWFKAI